ncbi:TetR/AcrR family transcriptional regulator [Telmatospirillum sp.]|uniref:TetR/AcrR family transcriptional regulator n=1 Tax=Telmatospirillum sp. TaxID=2079197 RepID=UPI00284A6B1C|nr:TetR/AcrR family transcriptional regulator [Telmatospirillum sp.]MDR3437472.1 TetR/AcrR family transcriptional regulator [Telmatospirillum sp.]
MPRLPLSEPERERVRRRILDAAQDLFDAGGIEAVSMRAIGVRVGLTASALYAYFPAKLDLIRALWQGALVELEHRLRDLSAREPDPMRTLALLGAAYADFALEEPVRFRLLFLTTTDLIGDALGAATESQAVYHLLRDRVAEAIRQGRLLITDADLAAQTVWAAIHGVVSLINTCGDFPFVEPQLLVHTMIQTVLRGMVRDDTERE